MDNFIKYEFLVVYFFDRILLLDEEMSDEPVDIIMMKPDMIVCMKANDNCYLTVENPLICFSLRCASKPIADEWKDVFFLITFHIVVYY